LWTIHAKKESNSDLLIWHVNVQVAEEDGLVEHILEAKDIFNIFGIRYNEACKTQLQALAYIYMQTLLLVVP